MQGLFITATDTGVGKTIITAALGLYYKSKGYKVAVVKPIQSGYLHNDPDGDAMLLKHIIDLDTPISDMILYGFAEPLAPLIAARLNNIAIDKQKIIKHIQTIAIDFDIILIEGAGGLMSPISDSWTNAELAEELGLPAIIVARPSLGTVNHTVLSVMAARAKGITIAGVILNHVDDNKDPSIKNNPELIEQFAFTEVLGTMPKLDSICDRVEILSKFKQNIKLENLIPID